MLIQPIILSGGSGAPVKLSRESIRSNCCRW